MLPRLIKFLQNNLAIATHFNLPFLVIFNCIELIERHIYLFLFYEEALATKNISASRKALLGKGRTRTHRRRWSLIRSWL